MELSLPAGVSCRANALGRQFIEIDHPAVRARVSLQGAQVTDCVPAGQLPLLWMSPTDPQAPDTALRGGIPLCWPWFADARPGPAHGIARTSHWQLQAAGSTEAGVQLVLQLPEQELRRQLPDEHWSVQVEILLGQDLQIILTSTNMGNRAQVLSQALHSYLPVSDIDRVRISGLEGATYIDKLASNSRARQEGPLLFSEEVDRIYIGTRADVTLHEENHDVLVVERGNSDSVVIWNPWLTKALRLSQFPENGYRQMVCIEAANAGPDARIIQPGQSHSLSTRISRQAVAP